MSGGSSFLVGRLERLREVRRIAKHQIVFPVKRLCKKIALDDRNSVAPCAFTSVFIGLCRRIRINLQCVDKSMFIPLRDHERKQPCARAYVKDTARLLDINPRAQKDTIRADFHGTAVLVHCKMFESKVLVGHYLLPVYFSLSLTKTCLVLRGKSPASIQLM